MKRCVNCFRYCENWRDAKSKGLDLKPHDTIPVGNYHYKPRPGVKAGCISVKRYKNKISPNHPACDGYIHRWRWNVRTWWAWHFVPIVRECYRRFIRVPIGSRRAAVPLKWQDYFDGCRDEIVPNGEPICPHCGEMPYSMEQCVFCGQKFKEE